LDRRSKKHGDGGKDVWNELAAALPHRSPKQVWAYGNRHWNPGNFKGPWTAVEEEMLRQHVAANGSKWAEAGRKIGRMPESCRDKWRMVSDHEVLRSLL
jgi:Myb-like DNA-binding protein REB1